MSVDALNGLSDSQVQPAIMDKWRGHGHLHCQAPAVETAGRCLTQLLHERANVYKQVKSRIGANPIEPRDRSRLVAWRDRDVGCRGNRALTPDVRFAPNWNYFTDHFGSSRALCLYYTVHIPRSVGAGVYNSKVHPPLLAHIHRLHKRP